jgi:hypothetical protein
MATVWASVWDWLAGVHADQWAAAAAWLTALVAVGAAAVAFVQLGEARRLRVEQAAPYVVVTMEPSPAAQWVIDLVIRNLGATAATDVELAITPPIERAAGERGAVLLPETIPVLVPGQEYRTLWDTAIARKDSGLPDRYEATVTFKDSHGKAAEPLRFVLDWSPLWLRDVVTVYTEHDAAKALREINKTLKESRERGASRGLAVFVRDGDAKDARTRAEWAERQARAEDSSTDAEDSSTDGDE